MTILVTAVVTLPGGLAAQRDDRTLVSGNSVESLVGNEEVCRQAPTSDAPALLRSAVEMVGLDAKAGQVLHFRAATSVTQDFQSERTYPPFFSLVRITEGWLDPASDAVRTEARFVYPGSGPAPSPPVLQDERAAFVVVDTSLVPAPPGLGAETLYPLDAWAVLRAWRDDPEVRVAERCEYRDYWRTVVARPSPHGDERLYLDEKTGFPVKLERNEPHYLLGQIHVEYVYSLWGDFEGAFIPRAAFRLVDGETEISRTVGTVAFVAAADAPSLETPAVSAPRSDRRPSRS